ncbi:FAD-dependent oxidoreductase [endosymbiont of Lamellibrachia barhami]|uniref:FAD-dependent oxidoreductase n=1 Tax=endosymbiont of Lamellibrachia barhami TaxID=205975 RepID=UPI0015AFA729|nr:FAD-dependent oxidoreductase [endosymbiont of Lamellibrachia barhami]
MKILETDIVIFGGGIAGLWTLGRLHQAGYRCLLLESGCIGGVQTPASQGIIHGGTKYALTGKLTGSSQAIRAMPGIWRDALAGHGELDLSAVRILSDHQYLWSTAGLVSRMAGFFAGKVMQSRIGEVEGENRPKLFQDKAFKGHVYRLEEPVLDVASLVTELFRQYGRYTLRIDWPDGIKFDAANQLVLLGDKGGRLQIRSRRTLLTAGAGNETLLREFGLEQPAMQRRPLQMVMLRGKLPPLYAHCLGAGANPRLTITSYPLADGDHVWYLGGSIAEEGVDRSVRAQVDAAKHELRMLMPWVDLSAAEWSTLRVDRAEPRQPGGKRPDNSFLEQLQDVMVAWPTKLAFAPRLAQQVIDRMQQDGIAPSKGELKIPEGWPRPPVTRLPWEQERQWF